MEFNPVEVFKIAVRMEDLGFYYYKKAADYTRNESIVSDVLASLAEMEKKHYFIFLKMEKQAAGATYADSAEITKYIGDKYGPSFFSEDLAAKIGNGTNSILDIFNLALEKETDSVQYYTLLRNVVTVLDTQMAIDMIIEQEKQHVQTVQDHIKLLAHKEGRHHEKN